MHVGQIFPSFEDLNNAVRNYEKVEKQKFVVLRSKSIKAVKLQHPLKESLKYYSITYVCIHGGKLRTRSKGIRKVSTKKMDCPSYIKVAASAVDQLLRVTGLEGTHKGHLFSQKVCDYLPQNRKLDKNETNFVKICLSVRGNKKLIQNKIHLSTGKKTTLKDLSNMAYQMKNTSNDLQNVVKTLKETYGCSVDVLHGEDHFFKGLYFSTKTMRSAVAAWPSFISIDGTYKLLNIGCTVFIFLVEDSENEIVGVALTCTEDAITFEWLLNRFKTENKIKDGDVKCIMADKDLLQRDVIKEVFPGVSVYICLFHTLKIMKREISCDKMKITKTERETALTLVQKLVYSMNESQYNENYEVLKSAVTSKVFDYIEKNWYPIRTEWTVYSMKNENLLNRTNNRLESINQKIKQVIAKNSSLQQFVKDFFIFVHAHENERDHRAAKLILKRPITNHVPESPEYEYLQLLTTYASQYVLSEINASKDLKILKYETSIKSCTCVKYSSMKLPCKHIFYIRRHLSEPLFEATLCHERWIKAYYLRNQRITAIEDNLEIDNPAISISKAAGNAVKSTSQKRQQALFITNSLANLTSESCYSSFEYRMDILTTIERYWRQGYEVVVDKVKEHDDENIEDVQENRPENAVLFEENQTLLVENLQHLDEHSRDYENLLVEGNLTNAGKKSHVDENVTGVNGENRAVVIQNQPHVEKNQAMVIKNQPSDIHPGILLNDIKMPLAIKRKGRPKGADLTVIGLRKQKKKGSLF